MAETPLYEVAARAGAIFADEAGWSLPAHFGKAAAEYDGARAGAVVFDRSHQGKLEAAGSDAVAFLHNLCSNDIKNLAPGCGCEAFFCTATGKVVAFAHIYRAPPHGKRESLWLDLEPGLHSKVLGHLDRYLISEDVTLADRTADIAQLHLAGPRAEAVLASALGVETQLALLQHTLARFDDSSCPVRRHDPLGLPGYDVLCPRTLAAPVWQALLAAGALPAGGQVYETLRIEAGTPRYGVDVDETTFAPEVGRTRQAISYNKGCYLGQEPIVMARDRGQVNRTLLGLKVGEAPVPAGSKLFRDGKEVGRVTSGVVSPRLGSAIALGYVRRGSQELGTVVEVDVNGERRPAEVAALPFAG
jgi:folate-binding protein YgfZ